MAILKHKAVYILVYHEMLLLNHEVGVLNCDGSPHKTIAVQHAAAVATAGAVK